jgi:outer membrane receptor protein involved in Fe transport
VLLNADHSFRAPNLDDLTSRQQTGPGFQFENAGLRPERATTAELGARVAARGVLIEVFVFGTVLTDAISRAPREVAQCPPATPQCQTSQARHQLVNVDGLSVVAGAELAARIKPFDGLLLQSAVSWTWGEGPNAATAPRPGVPFAARVPLSRIPPLNGSVEAVWTASFGLSAGAAVRWAGPQLRLAPSDLSDSRIPEGGTGGFAVVDLRGSWRFGTNVVGAVVLENLFNSAYRYHGSSVNGPARGVIVTVEVAPW